jgi:uncharacterized membrane protein
VWDDVGALREAVGAQFLAFAISFAVIASYWLAHHQMVASFVAIDNPVIVLNLLLVGAIVVLPFSTEAVGNPGLDDLPLPTALLALNVAAASALHTSVYVIARRRALLDPRPTRDEFAATVRDGLAPAAVFLISIPIAYVTTPTVAQLSWLSLVVIRPLAARRTSKAREGSARPVSPGRRRESDEA